MYIKQMKFPGKNIHIVEGDNKTQEIGHSVAE